MKKAWEGVTEMPVRGRSSKPRTTGLTMVIDKGIGMNQIKDMVQTSGEYIDIIKLTFGTSAFYDREFLMEKIQLLIYYGLNMKDQKSIRILTNFLNLKII